MCGGRAGGRVLAHPCAADPRRPRRVPRDLAAQCAAGHGPRQRPALDPRVATADAAADLEHYLAVDRGVHVVDHHDVLAPLPRRAQLRRRVRWHGAWMYVARAGAALRALCCVTHVLLAGCVAAWLTTSSAGHVVLPDIRGLHRPMGGALVVRRCWYGARLAGLARLFYRARATHSGDLPAYRLRDHWHRARDLLLVRRQAHEMDALLRRHDAHRRYVSRARRIALLPSPHALTRALIG